MAHSPNFLKLVQDAKTRVKETNVPNVKGAHGWRRKIPAGGRARRQ